MRNGSAAIVPLFIGIMLLFWAIMFLGDAGDTLQSVSKAENLQHIQTKLLLPALKKKYEEEIDNGLSSAEASANAQAYVKKIMYENKIDTTKE